MIKLIIFDFDGVLVDTQQIVNELDWQYLARYGVSISLENFTKRFSGETALSIIERLKTEDHIEFPRNNKTIAKEIDDSAFEALSKMKILPIQGVEEILSHLSLKKCVASNCSSHILKALLKSSGLAPHFEDKVFSADDVKSPKPSPDLFLYAAHKLGEPPQNSLIIEDSEVGVKAAVSAGMTVVGFLGGSHITPSDSLKLIKAGAEQVFTDMKQLNSFLISLQKAESPLSSSKKDHSSRDYEAKRASMVKLQLEARHIHDPSVLKAMSFVPRHLFVPEEFQELAYADSPLPIGHSQTISQPYIVALICEAAALSPTDRVLDIGTGSGYQAAILSQLSKEVYSIELIKPLGEQAQELLHKLGYTNVHVKIGNGYEGWRENAPYDAILVAAAAAEVPQALLEQLNLNGRLIIPLGVPFHQYLMKFTKTKNGFKKENLGNVSFVPFKKN